MSLLAVSSQDRFVRWFVVKTCQIGNSRKVEVSTELLIVLERVLPVYGILSAGSFSWPSGIFGPVLPTWVAPWEPWVFGCLGVVPPIRYLILGDRAALRASRGRS